MLAVSNLEVAYGQSVVVRGLNLTLAEGEIVALLGRNGMGKTTLMRALMGILPLRSGSITFAGREVARLPSFERVRAGLAYVPQGRGIFGSLTVEENIATGLAARGARAVPEDLYALFPVLDTMRQRRGGNLSGGQQQQLAIARALAARPKALLLDEPTEGIQPSIVRELARTLRQIRDQRGVAMLLAEQVLAFAFELADRILVIENGRLVHEAARGAFDEASLTRFLAVCSASATPRGGVPCPTFSSR